MKKWKKGILKNVLTTKQPQRKLAFLIVTILLIAMVSSLISNTTAATSALVLHVDGKNIKDSSGAVLYLRGANQPDFANDADGAWYGSTLWTDSNAKAQLDVMKSWGINTVRCMFAVNQWKDNTIDTRSAIHDRDAIKRLISFAGDRGMYVILTGYTLKSTITVGQDAYQDPLPYPPYQTTPGGSSVISSQQDFVNFWASVANELKGYPNVIFELWNEPQGTSAVLNTWLSVSQQCITAIRNTGSQNLIIISGSNWGSTWVNVDTTYREDMSWVFNHQFTGGNIIFGVHMYSQALQGSVASSYQYSAVDYALSLMRYYDVANSYPLIVSEICPNMDYNVANEQVFFQNALSLFNSHGISYTAWGWWSATHFRLLSSESPNYTPNSAGTILKNALAVTPTQGSTSTPAPSVSPTQSGAFKVGDRVQNIYAPSNIGTIMSVDSARSWAEVRWDSGQTYGIAFSCLKLISAAQPSVTSTPAPSVSSTQSGAFKVGDRVQNIYAPSNIGTIMSVDSARSWAEVRWDSGQNYGIAFNCIKRI